MNPEPEYPYPNWLGRPMGNPAKVIKALRQCRKSATLSCAASPDVLRWSGHFHYLNKQAYRARLAKVLEALYGSLPDVQRDALAGIDRDNAGILWNALLNEARATGEIPFFRFACPTSETLISEQEEAIEPGGWLSREELVAENKRLRRALERLTSALSEPIAIAQEVLDATE